VQPVFQLLLLLCQLTLLLSLALLSLIGLFNLRKTASCWHCTFVHRLYCDVKGGSQCCHRTKAFVMSCMELPASPAPPTSFVPPRLLVNKRSSIERHSLYVGLGRHRLARIAHLAQQLEVVDVKCRRRSEEQLRLLIRRVGEGVRRPDRHRHVIADVCVDDFFVFARVVRVRDVEADGALCDVEGLVVHFVPVRWRTGRFGWERELDGSEAVVCGFLEGCLDQLLFNRFSLMGSVCTCTRAIFENTACDLAQMDRFACFRWDKVEWAIWDLDEAIETDASGSHDVNETVLAFGVVSRERFRLVRGRARS
jgi:hypothetical protein